MQKDYYQPDGQLQLNGSELDRIDAFWTSKWSGQTFDAFENRRYIEASDEFKAIAHSLRTLVPGSRILDGGCGMGQWTMYLKEQGYHPTGLDISSSTIKRLQERFLDHDWVTGDINNLPYPNETFDAYLSWGTFEHFEAGLNAPIKEAKRVLKENGLLFISVPQDSLRLLPERYCRRWSSAAIKAGSNHKFYQWRLTKNEIAFELGCENFKILSITALSKREGLGRLFKLMTGLEPSGPFKGRLIKALAPFFPGVFVGHMLMVIAQKVEAM